MQRVDQSTTRAKSFDRGCRASVGQSRRAVALVARWRWPEEIVSLHIASERAPWPAASSNLGAPTSLSVVYSGDISPHAAHAFVAECGASTCIRCGLPVNACVTVTARE